MHSASSRRTPPGTAAQRPVLPGFYPDPTVCRVGDDYYLANSSFEYFPGAPIWHSRDLLTWQQIGHILDSRSQFVRGSAQPSTGIYGSTLRHHDGRFWFVTTNMSDAGSGQVLVHADDPSGPWSEPVFVPEALGIDPDLCWDESGTCYLTWNELKVTGQLIRQAPLDVSTGRFLEPAYELWQGSGLMAPEGPHLYRIGEVWYLLLAEGGTERGHCVTIARGPSPRGPFEACPANPVLTHRSTGHPVQNVGHADLVETPDGGWAAVYLGVRPHGPTPGYHVLGRETFLAGIDWQDGWPVFDEGRFDVPVTESWFVDDFASPSLDQRWVVPGGEADAVASQHPSGGLDLRTPADGSGSMLCTRVRDMVWTADATVVGAGRFLLRMDDTHWYGLVLQDGTVRAQARLGDLEAELADVRVGEGPVVLRIEAVPPIEPWLPFGAAGPDDIVLSVHDGGGFHQLARLDGRYLSTEVASGFTGRMLAVGPAGARGRVLSVEYVPQHPQDA